MQLGSVLLLEFLLSGYEGHLNMAFSKVRNSHTSENFGRQKKIKGTRLKKLGSDEIARETSF